METEVVIDGYNILSVIQQNAKHKNKNRVVCQHFKKICVDF
jgi:hypothetical protein